MFTDTTAIHNDIDKNSTWTLKNLAVVTLILVVFPALMFAASFIPYPGDGDAPGVKVAPAALVDNGLLIESPDVSGYVPQESEQATADSQAGACPHSEQGGRGACCGSTNKDKGCTMHAPRITGKQP